MVGVDGKPLAVFSNLLSELSKNVVAPSKLQVGFVAEGVFPQGLAEGALSGLGLAASPVFVP